MKVIRITPGLGNQMFQYAFLLNYKLKGEKIALDISPCKHSKKHNGYELEKIFNIKEEYISVWTKIKYNGPYFYFRDREITLLKIINKIIQKVFRGKYILNSNRNIFEKIGEEFNPRYLELKENKYIAGYFNDERYFETIKSEVRKAFTFPKIKNDDEKNFEILKEIKNSESVSIHIRRGDYIDTNLDICGIDYYQESFDFLKNKLKDKELKFFIFSDDILWCKENLDFLKKEKVFYIDWNKKENSYKDMQLMSECKHNIIPNSTFSWWGAYLNKNEDKILIAPKYWFKNILNSKDRCNKDWIIV